jgi:cobalt-precorrin 5A hydrolase
VAHGIVIVAGFGCRVRATPAALAAALAATGHDRPDALAIPADRAALLAPLAARLEVPLIPLAAEALVGVVTPTSSPASLRARGTGSVAEAAALVAAGPGARLIVSRRINPDRLATCAIARSSVEGPT